MGTIHEQQTNGHKADEVEAKTNAELTTELKELRAELRRLQIRLFGDEELRAKWAENKRTFVTPNYPEPPLGSLQQYDERLSDIAGVLTGLQNLFNRQFEEVSKNFAFVSKVGAWIGPLMDRPEFQPPLNGAQIASKTYVDDAVSRLSGALRDEMSIATQLAKTLYKLFSRDIELAAVTWNMQPVDPRQKALAVIDEVANRLHASWQWVVRADREASKPGALERLRQAARYAITGRQDGQ